MTREEFSDGFSTLVNSYRRFKDFDKKEELDSIDFDEYEKSLWLTKAQEALVVGLYNGRNVTGESFESTEEMRRYLETLVKTKTYSVSEQVAGSGVSSLSKFYEAPSDLAFIVMEQIALNDDSLGCYNGATIEVRPVTHDEYERIKFNPFVGPSKRRALRIDAGGSLLEIISKYTIGTYLLRYMSRPTPIILEDLPNGLTIDGVSIATDCVLNPLLHQTILEQAVRMALSSKAINTKTE